MGEAQQCIEATATFEPVPASARPDGEGQQLATVMGRED
jgi:hypothetical protein